MRGFLSASVSLSLHLCLSLSLLPLPPSRVQPTSQNLLQQISSPQGTLSLGVHIFQWRGVQGVALGGGGVCRLGVHRHRVEPLIVRGVFWLGINLWLSAEGKPAAARLGSRERHTSRRLPGAASQGGQLHRTSG